VLEPFENPFGPKVLPLGVATLVRTHTGAGMSPSLPISKRADDERRVRARTFHWRTMIGCNTPCD
jgi:hypothetical protein